MKISKQGFCLLAMVTVGCHTHYHYDQPPVTQAPKKAPSTGFTVPDDDRGMMTVSIGANGEVSTEFVKATSWRISETLELDGQPFELAIDPATKRQFVRSRQYPNAMALCPVFVKVLQDVDGGGNGSHDLAYCVYPDGKERGKWAYSPPERLPDGRVATWAAHFTNWGCGHYSAMNEPGVNGPEEFCRH